MAPYYDLLYSHHDYDSDCDLVETLMTRLGFRKPSSILDIGCGTGQHSIRLSRRGHRVVGIDLSVEMLKIARKNTVEMGLDIEFWTQDMRRISLDDQYDCAICLFGAFSRLSKPRDFQKFFEGLKKVLRAGGLFVFDFIEGGRLKDGQKSWRVIQQGDLKVVLLDELKVLGSKVRDHHEIIAIRGERLVDHFVEEHDLQTHDFDSVEQMLLGQDFARIYPGESTDRGSRIAATMNK